MKGSLQWTWNSLRAWKEKVSEDKDKNSVCCPLIDRRTVTCRMKTEGKGGGGNGTQTSPARHASRKGRVGKQAGYQEEQEERLLVLQKVAVSVQSSTALKHPSAHSGTD